MSGNPKHTKFVSPPLPHSMTQHEESYVEKRWHMRKKELSMPLMQRKNYMLSPKIMCNYEFWSQKLQKSIVLKINFASLEQWLQCILSASVLRAVRTDLLTKCSPQPSYMASTAWRDGGSLLPVWRWISGCVCVEPDRMQPPTKEHKGTYQNLVFAYNCMPFRFRSLEMHPQWSGKRERKKKQSLPLNTTIVASNVPWDTICI